MLANSKQEVLSYHRELKRNQDISRKLVNEMGKVKEETAKWQNESIISRCMFQEALLMQVLMQED